MSYVISVVLGYLLGSVNASIIISMVKGTDIRRHGSGNAGATNTLRTLGMRAAALVLASDILKGVLAVLLSRLMFKNDTASILAGFAAVAGHNFPVYYGFRGGKGVLTSLAVAMTLEPAVAAVALTVGIIVIALTRYVSLGSVAGALALPVAAAFFCRGDAWMLAFMTAVGLFVIIRHHENIERLIEGKERKIDLPKRK